MSMTEGSLLRENALWLIRRVLRTLRIDPVFVWPSTTQTAEKARAAISEYPKRLKETEDAFLVAQRNIAEAYLFMDREKLRRL